MPAIAPPESEADREDVADTDADADAETVDKVVEVATDLTDDPDVERDEAEVDAVAAINASESNVNELADGFAEERDEYNKLKDLMLIFVKVFWAEEPAYIDLS